MMSGRTITAWYEIRIQTLLVSGPVMVDWVSQLHTVRLRNTGKLSSSVNTSTFEPLQPFSTFSDCCITLLLFEAFHNELIYYQSLITLIIKNKLTFVQHFLSFHLYLLRYSTVCTLTLSQSLSSNASLSFCLKVNLDKNVWKWLNLKVMQQTDQSSGTHSWVQRSLNSAAGHFSTYKLSQQETLSRITSISHCLSVFIQTVTHTVVCARNKWNNHFMSQTENGGLVWPVFFTELLNISSRRSVILSSCLHSVTAYFFAADGCCPLKLMRRSVDQSLFIDTQLGSGSGSGPGSGPGPEESGLWWILIDREEEQQGGNSLFSLQPQ